MKQNIISGCDKIQIEQSQHQDLFTVKIRFVRNLSKDLESLYQKLGVEPSIKNEIALEIELTQSEYYNIFIKDRQ